MAKNRQFEEMNEDVGLTDLLNGINGLRREVRLIKASLVSEHKAAYTNQEVLEMFHIASATLKKWRDTGLIGYTLVGKVYLYSKADIDKFLEDHHFSSYSSQKGFLKSIRSL